MACIGENRIAYRVLVEKLEGKRPLGRDTRTVNDNIKMDHEEIRRRNTRTPDDNIKWIMKKNDGETRVY